MEFADRAKFYWGNLTWEELRQVAARKPVVIQPIGATEQHGYHLPLNTDNFIVTRLCDAAGRRAPDELLVLPVVPFAFNAHHMDFPGVVAIQWDHVINYLIDITFSVTAHGFDRFIFISGHGVNPPYLAVTGNEVNVRTGALCASLLWTALADNVTEIRESVVPGGMAHACELETAVMLYLDPERVREDRVDGRDRTSSRAASCRWTCPPRRPASISASTGGAVFRPAASPAKRPKARPEKGRLIFERAADNLVALVRELRSRPDPALTRVDRH